jgi:hypothetical protein
VTNATINALFMPIYMLTSRMFICPFSSTDLSLWHSKHNTCVTHTHTHTHTHTQYIIVCNSHFPTTVELHLSGLIGTANQPDMKKIRIIGSFFESRLHWQSVVRLLLFTVCTCV